MVQHSTTAKSAAAGNKSGIVSSLQGLRPLPLSLPGTASSRRLSSKSKRRPRRVVNDGDDVRRTQPRRPVILYEDTPEVIHARPDEFKALVQRLTGRQPNGTAGGRGDQDQEAVLRAAETAAAALSSQEEQDPLVLTLGQQHIPPPPLPLVVVDDDDDHTPPVLPPPSPGGADGGFLLSPRTFLFSPATMEAIQELIS